MKSDPVNHLGAARLAREIAAGSLSARHAVEAHIAAAEQQHGRLNALVARRFDLARQEAAAVDAAREAGRPLGPLAGVPCSLKEVLDLEGFASTSGLPAYAGNVVARDGEAVMRLRSAGGVVLGKTNDSQLLIYLEADNPLFGRTSNPHDPLRTCGGSSGGEAALIASGGSALGLGTDIGGSLRVPAACCGIASLKPTAGLVPDPGRLSIPAGQLGITSQIGPMARKVEDLALALDVLAPGRPRPGPTSARNASVHGLRVGVVTEDGLFRPGPAIRRAVGQAADALREAGAQVTEFRWPEPQLVRELFYSLVSADAGAHFGRLLKGGAVDPRIRQLMIAAGLPRPIRRVAAALAARAGQVHLPPVLRAMGRRTTDEYFDLCDQLLAYRDRFDHVMDEGAGGPVDLILSPVMPVPAFHHGASKDLGVPGIYTTVYNVTGLPAGAVPVSRVKPGEESDRPTSKDLAERAALAAEQGSAGLPLVVQVAGRRWCEDQVLAAMSVIEAAAH